MKNRLSRTLMTIALAAGLVGLGLSASAAAQSSCSGSYTTSLSSGQYIFQMNEFDSSAPECISINGVGFNITSANIANSLGGSPAGYASIFRGCHWGNCTSSNPFPIQVSSLGSASTAVSISQPGGSQNDSAYDIWFNQTSSTGGQPNGTEIMIWINHQGSVYPFGSQVGTANIDGANYNVWVGRASSWNVVTYEAQSGATSANFNLLPFFSDAESRSQLSSSWYLIDVEFGFEVWTGGTGLAMSNFSVSASANGSASSNTSSSTLISNGTHTIKNRNSGLLLEDMNASMNNGQFMDQWPSNGCNCQDWTVTNLGNNYVYLINQRSSLALDNYAASTSSGGKVDQWGYWGGTQQQWQVVSAGSGYYYLINRYSGLYLSVPNWSGSGGTLVDQEYADNGANQQWSIQ